MNFLQNQTKFTPKLVEVDSRKSDNSWNLDLDLENESTEDYEGIDINEEDLEVKALEYFQRKAILPKEMLHKF